MRLAFLLVSSLFACVASAAEMYRTVAADGTVIFSDRPLGANSEYVGASGAQATRTAPPPAPPTIAQLAASTPGSTVVPNTSPQEVAQQMAENCDAATQRLAGLMRSDQLYQVLPNGDREFLSAEDIQTTREQARAQVARWCE